MSATEDGTDKKRPYADEHVNVDVESEPKKPRGLSKLDSPSILEEESSSSGSDTADPPLTTTQEIVAKYAPLDPWSSTASPLKELTANERSALEKTLELSTGSGWRDDWAGNLAFADEMISNPEIGKTQKNSSYKQSFLAWAALTDSSRKLLYNLLRFVYHWEGTPRSAKRILEGADVNSLNSIESAIRRCSYDPVVLAEDGWTTERSKEPSGATGGPYRIGDPVRWDGADAIVIAYLHDEDIGDLWKILWTDETRQSADLEAEELEEAKKKYQRRQKHPGRERGDSRRSTRLTLNENFSVEGIETGIVLATSFAKGVRRGVYWPARVMHASELRSDSRRGSSKQKVDLVFLAPYWDSSDQRIRSTTVDVLSTSVGSENMPLLLVESIDANEEMIKPYSYLSGGEIDIDQLRYAFRFTGLPKSVFNRFLDAHRLAQSLAFYAKMELSTERSFAERATAALFDKHPLSMQAPLFPSAVLHLPFSYMLRQLPERARNPSNGVEEESREPIISLSSVIQSMRPPHVFGNISGNSPRATATVNGEGIKGCELNRSHKQSVEEVLVPSSTPGVKELLGTKMNRPPEQNMELPGTDFDQFVASQYRRLVSKVPSLNLWLSQHKSIPAVRSLLIQVPCLDEESQSLVPDISQDWPREDSEKYDYEKSRCWSRLNLQGNEIISSMCSPPEKEKVLEDWRRVMQHLFLFSSIFGFRALDKTAVLTDMRCNHHITSNGCFERTVRMAAALKAVKKVSQSGKLDPTHVLSCEGGLYSFVEKEILPRVHDSVYLRVMKDRCKSIKQGEVAALTEDSDGRGGHDTVGSLGSWEAAVGAASAAVESVERVLTGEFLNAFSVTRPPGHHAGRKIHCMKAISNGFCILNNVACAAVYATSFFNLRKIAIIDIDVHHGNGTQDILCSTYDPRYFYISLHAGGAHVNGSPAEDDPQRELHDLGGSSKRSGIFPGRCGDTSPHSNVLNIPLGRIVTPHALGEALLTKVKPAILNYMPDLILMSTGFDAHKNDPMGLGTLSSEDFGHVTDLICELAQKVCGGRLVSVLEGGYGVPCCRPQRPWVDKSDPVDKQPEERVQPSQILDLSDVIGDEIIEDQVPPGLQRHLEKCHQEGFMDCVEAHLRSLIRNNNAPLAYLC